MFGIKEWIKRSPRRKRVALWLMRVFSPLLPPFTMRAIPEYVRFFSDMRRFRCIGGKIEALDWYPCLFDRTPTTSFDAQYLYQAAWGAKKIFEARPEVHFDVGSHLGFVTQLAAFTMVEFIDIRPANISLENFGVRKGLITDLPLSDFSVSSISSMHVIEHIGLGRYGDPIQLDGPQCACREISRVLRVGGRAYVSVPIGRPRVGFNGLYVFDAAEFPKYFDSCDVIDFAYVDTNGVFYDSFDHRSVVLQESNSGMDFGLGIYVLQKK